MNGDLAKRETATSGKLKTFETQLHLYTAEKSERKAQQQQQRRAAGNGQAADVPARVRKWPDITLAEVAPRASSLCQRHAWENALRCGPARAYDAC